MTHDHAHGTTPAGRNEKRLTVVFVLTAFYLVVEVVGGLLTNSLALLADAGHMLTDVAGTGLALLALRFARRPASPERTYGFYRAEILAALTNAVVLIGVSLYVLYEAYRRFREPPEVQSLPMLAVAAVGLAVNVLAMWLLRAGSGESLNLKGAYFEVLSDALTSVGVIVAGVVMWATGWYYADPLVSAGIGLFILPRTWNLLREAVGVLLEGTPADVNLTAVREAIAGVPGVAGTHDLHVWSLTSGMNALSVHVVLAAGADLAAVLTGVHGRVTGGFPISHVTVQAEPPGWQEGETHL
ncbi:MAG: cation diffusion facilitator family transporter [Gemmataceae bacterium]|nr:cation diffusion facilitator family transporter [Gemmataceae bacterium]